jgi:hypothetical protein
MLRRLIIFTIFTVILLCSVALTDEGGAAAFNQLPVSVKMLGLGGAGVALSDSSVVYTNPAILATVCRSEVFLFGGVLLGGVNYLSFGFNGNEENFLGLTAAVQLVNVTAGEFREAYYDNGSVGLTGNKFGYNGTNLIFSFAKKLTDTFSIGVNTKYLRESLKDNSAAGMGLDVGLSYAVTSKFFLGLVMQNTVAPQMTWNTDEETKEAADPRFILGSSYYFRDNLALLADVSSTVGQTGYNVGIEYALNQFFSLRAGTDSTGYSIGSSLYVDKFSLHFAYLIDSAISVDTAYYLSGSYAFDIKSLPSAVKETKIMTENEKKKEAAPPPENAATPFVVAKEPMPSTVNKVVASSVITPTATMTPEIITVKVSSGAIKLFVKTALPVDSMRIYFPKTEKHFNLSRTDTTWSWVTTNPTRIKYYRGAQAYISYYKKGQRILRKKIIMITSKSSPVNPVK